MTRYEPPLRWMCYEAISVGIRINLPGKGWSITPCEGTHESLTGLWKLLEYVPIVPKPSRYRKGILRRFVLYSAKLIVLLRTPFFIDSISVMVERLWKDRRFISLCTITSR